MFILLKVHSFLEAVIQTAYLKTDHSKDSHDPLLLGKKKKKVTYRTPSIPKTSLCSLESGDLNVLKTSLVELELENYFLGKN